MPGSYGDVYKRQPERDIFYIHNAQGHELDPCSDERGVQTKMGIDATLNEESRCLEPVSYTHLDVYKRQVRDGGSQHTGRSGP